MPVCGAAAAGGSAAVVPGHIKKELTAAKRRESELSMRTAALEAQVEQAQNSRQELQQLVDEKEAKLAEKEAKLQVCKRNESLGDVEYQMTLHDIILGTSLT